MKSVDFRVLETFAAACRHGLESLGGTRTLMFYAFPQGACGPASELMGRLLDEELGIPGVYVCGDGHPNLEGNQSHAWVEVGKFILDITHDQFDETGLGGWVFPKENPWHQQFGELEKRPGFVMPSGWPMYPHDGYVAMRTALQRACGEGLKEA